MVFVGCDRVVYRIGECVVFELCKCVVFEMRGFSSVNV